MRPQFQEVQLNILVDHIMYCRGLKLLSGDKKGVRGNVLGVGFLESWRQSKHESIVIGRGDFQGGAKSMI